MQLKALVNNYAKEKRLNAQAVLQLYMLEHFLEKVSKSPYKQNFILKGGMLIASIVDVSNRTTMDMDGAVLKYPVNSTTTEAMIREICSFQPDDEVKFQFMRIEEIRDEDKYSGYRVHLLAIFDRLRTDMKIDITTGDAITPGPILRTYKTILTGRRVEIYSYPTETVIAEKVETIISRGLTNTRFRDFYDVYVLYKCQQFNYVHLKRALQNTSTKRGTTTALVSYEDILTAIEHDEIMNAGWDKFSKRYSYTEGITFKQCINAVWLIASLLEEKEAVFEDEMAQEEIDDHIMKGVEDAKNGRTLTMEEFKKYISDLQNTK